MAMGLVALLAASPAQAGNYADNGDGTVTDQTTGLVWEKAGSASGMNWGQALAWCEQTTTAGYTDWRLPNKRELEHLADKSRLRPAIDPAFTEPINWYWSSTTYAGNSANAWGVSFDFGGAGNDKTKGYTGHVRCVRGGPQS
ncbi:MAG: DUF1566 domain-containing protein [Solidesulfovibrio sp. DCME]|uniref:Lcl C-terminal domain-containing protein n=1 Tax=Solidesulfovibrio sp. DCME TaxID=3447380 RepID=UPI003D10A0AF